MYKLYTFKPEDFDAQLYVKPFADIAKRLRVAHPHWYSKNVIRPGENELLTSQIPNLMIEMADGLYCCMKRIRKEHANLWFSERDFYYIDNYE